ncbi:histone deacetylase 11-like [Xenia sp. Carnegie-2017]|uniref:histone deacetylase 11-like n=1 Tax=Xenia sp. Carnegie-2017 TaxID=2897299 RepID=UPI001F04F8FD|nr:histone deacetylase 11-like [Xenia sp. Carnegie-2017]XP_046851756.1 histone deacetylase 11-like [Xenia sp. Carnegie-2017]
MAEKINFDLYKDLQPSQIPLVYSHRYNIKFFGLQKLHPFDSEKWGKVVGYLSESDVLKNKTFVEPLEASEEYLLKVHTQRYLDNLKWSWRVASITEVPPVAFLPNFIVQRILLRPLRLQTGGTILAGKLAVDNGWAINVGGGFHHCSSDKGGGFCAYADITLALNFLFEKASTVSKAMIVDLDAHQGNGHERDFLSNPQVYIMDVYNSKIYPFDKFAKRAINKMVELDHETDDDKYLSLVERNLNEALDEFEPHIIAYNAGTDILKGDPLGNLAITEQGIILRDELVFEAARKRKIPIFMVTSGGYQKHTAKVIADSIINLHKKGLIS